VQPDAVWQWERAFTEVGSELQREETNEVLEDTEQNDSLDGGDGVRTRVLDTLHNRTSLLAA